MGASAGSMLNPTQCLRLRSQVQCGGCLAFTRARCHPSSSHRQSFTTTVHLTNTSPTTAHRQPLQPRCVPLVQRRTAMKGGQTSSARSQMYQNVKMGPREGQTAFDRKASQGTQSREAIQNGEMPDDAPLFPGTLIMPTFSDLWKQLRLQERNQIAYEQGLKRKAPGMSLGDRVVKLNYRTAKQMLFKQTNRTWRHGQDLFSIISQWHYGLGWPGIFKRKAVRKLRVDRHNMRKDAIAMYGKMYKALYSNDANTLREICCNNTSKQLAARCRFQLGKGISYDWKLIEHLGWDSKFMGWGSKVISWVPRFMGWGPKDVGWIPKVMSHKAVPYPLDDGTGFPMIFRQAVIRIHSRQRLTPKEHGVESGASKEVDIFEFLVLQKRFYMGKEEPWKIWGTVKEATSAEEWLETMYPDPMAGAVQTVGST